MVNISCTFRHFDFAKIGSKVFKTMEIYLTKTQQELILKFCKLEIQSFISLYINSLYFL